MHHAFALARFVLCAAATAAAAGCCQTCNWRGQGYTGDTAHAWTKDLRPPADEKKLSGVDAKARDIERSLGVR
jgi:hypothetical protein